MEKKIIILGSIGKNARKNRDGFRVFARVGGVRDLAITHSYGAAVGS